jgi:predicted amino acid racemase
MSVSLRTVLEAAGYDLSTLEDNRWLLSVRREFEELIEKADFMIDQEIEKALEASETAYEMKREDDDL